MNTPRSEFERLGFSTIETVMATALVGLLLVVSLNSAAFVVEATDRESEYEQASQIASILLSEIQAMPFQDPTDGSATLGLETDETSLPRADWDDCDDYNGWSSSAITTLAGPAVDEAAGWAVSVSVAFCLESDPTTTSLSETQLKQIELQLTSPSSRTFIMYGLRSATGPLLDAQSPATKVLNYATITSDRGTTAVRIQNQQEP